MDVFKQILNWCGDQISALLSWVTVLLPDSPFKLLDNTPLKPYLSTINYFIPMQFIIDVTLAWLAAIVIYYGYSVILRWIRAIQ